jgi:hypothetical protein
MILNTTPEGKRVLGRLKMRWLDDAEASMKTLGIKKWRLNAQDREEWTAILREAKAKLKEP